MKLKWDETGKRFYHTGVSHTVVYPIADDGTYPKGTAWTGVTGIDENPDGAEANELYADNIKYAIMRSAETYGVTISAYNYPDEFLPCDGVATIAPGMFIRQQTRQAFGLVWRTEIGNDIGSYQDDGYIIHCAYGLTVSPSDTNHETINDNPDADEFSWEAEGMPVPMKGYKPVYKIEFDSRTLSAAALTALEDVLYGTDGENNAPGTDARLPLPDDLKDIIESAH